MICRKCGKNYLRAYCDYCSRADRWGETKYTGDFTPRIQKDLKDIDITIDENQLMYVREGGGLYLTGVSGCGKSLYAAKMMLESMRLTFINQTGPKHHMFVTVPELFDKVRQSFNDEVPFNWIGYYSNVQFLVLDDLGAEKTTDWTLDQLYLLINFRYEHNKATIFTSNLSLEELEGLIGERFSSRINQMSMVSTLKEIDYRI